MHGTHIPPAARARPPHRSTLRDTVLLGLILPGILAGCDAGTLEPELEPELQSFVDQVNDHRESVGCPRLVWNQEVAEVARAHSHDMIDRDFFAHTNPDGVTAAQRLRNAGVDYRRMAENIAWGYPTGSAVLQGWLGSPGHRANIENCALLEHGAGLVGTHWTHKFVTM
jgi:uncharacterized protein YkwD